MGWPARRRMSGSGVMPMPAVLAGWRMPATPARLDDPADWRRALRHRILLAGAAPVGVLDDLLPAGAIGRPHLCHTPRGCRFRTWPQQDPPGCREGLRRHVRCLDRQHPATSRSRSRAAHRRSSGGSSGPGPSREAPAAEEHQGRTGSPHRGDGHRSVGTSSPRRLEAPSVIPVPVMVRRSGEGLGRLQWPAERRLHKDHGLQVHLQRQSPMELEMAAGPVPRHLGPSAWALCVAGDAIHTAMMPIHPVRSLAPS